MRLIYLRSFGAFFGLTNCSTPLGSGGGWLLYFHGLTPEVTTFRPKGLLVVCVGYLFRWLAAGGYYIGGPSGLINFVNPVNPVKKQHSCRRNRTAFVRDTGCCFLSSGDA